MNISVFIDEYSKLSSGNSQFSDRLHMKYLRTERKPGKIYILNRPKVRLNNCEVDKLEIHQGKKGLQNPKRLYDNPFVLS